MTLNDLCAQLLPPEEYLTFKTLIMGEHGITFVATMTSPKSACPDCHHLASCIHSDYPRTLADLPWATMPIQLRLIVRRFFCTTCTWGRQTFTERLPEYCRRFHGKVAPDPGHHGCRPSERSDTEFSYELIARFGHNHAKIKG